MLSRNRSILEEVIEQQKWPACDRFYEPYKIIRTIYSIWFQRQILFQHELDKF